MAVREEIIMSKTRLIVTISVILVGVLVFFIVLGWVEGVVAALLGGDTARKTLKEYRALEAMKHKVFKEVALEEEAKVRLLDAEYRKVEKEALDLSPEAKGEELRIKTMTTPEALLKEENAQLDEAEKWLDKAKKFGITGLMLIVALVSLFPSMGHTETLVEASKALAVKRSRVIKSYQRYILDLKKQALVLRRKLVAVEAKLRRRDVELEMAVKRHQITASVPCRAVWPYAVGFLAVGLVIGFPVGVGYEHFR